MSISKDVKAKFYCYHCGEECKDSNISINEKIFCCNGCKTVYEILNKSNLCNYYSIDQTPGKSPKEFESREFDYLDDEKIIKQLNNYIDDKISIVTFTIPQMHCSSCIWLLENLYKLDEGISHSEVDFLKKELTVRYNHNKISLKKLVQLTSSIGYEPQIQLDVLDKKRDKASNKKLYYKLGIAAFCFGNIMLFSFPEYLSINVSDVFFKRFFGCLNLILALPVLFYSSSEYFISAYKGLKKKIVNIDFPVSLGIIVLFFRSTIEILTHSGAGYFDSMTGLVLFLLIGKLFQQKTYQSLNFERNYKSYFPLSVSVKKNNKQISKSVSDLVVGDRIVVRNNEIIPADSILFSGTGNIDYSFVTGESKPVNKVMGEFIYAGGRQQGESLELEVVKEVSQSYLTQLWNNNTFKKKEESDFTALSNHISKYFTAVVILIAVVSSALWLPVNLGIALNVFTAVLIVACPCALALSTPFTLGNTLRIFGKNKFYLKNTASIEEMAKVDEIVFDKTGTLTKINSSEIKYVGKELDGFEQEIVKSLVGNSNHPLSRKIYSFLEGKEKFAVSQFNEKTGEGIEGIILGNKIKVGSIDYVSSIGNNDSAFEMKKDLGTRVYLSLNNKVAGYFNFSAGYRKGIKELLKNLSVDFSLNLLSGDNDTEKEKLIEYFGKETGLFFQRSPQNKLDFVKNLQGAGKNILMVGDGLNDAGALAQSNVGIAVTEDTNNFSPACDAILEADNIDKLFEFIKFSKTSVKIILISFIISFIYNLAGLGFAVMGLLSPIVAAVLMPVSSISVVVFATITTNLIAKKRGLISL
ncbi:MAG: heavy metal translocating P-type ATPase metal-binding domain-containing protein [Ignavibacteriaceae bacterium]